MVVVTVEIWPHGDARRKREAAKVVISNVGGDQQTGEYNAAMQEDGKLKRVDRIVHERADGVLSLLAKTLRSWHQ
jgi:hypothetical protein